MGCGALKEVGGDIVVGDFVLDPDDESPARSLEPRVVGRRDADWLPLIVDEREGGGGGGVSGRLTPAATSTADALSMYFSISFSLFHFMYLSNRLAVLVYNTVISHFSMGTSTDKRPLTSTPKIPQIWSTSRDISFSTAC